MPRAHTDALGAPIPGFLHDVPGWFARLRGRVRPGDTATCATCGVTVVWRHVPDSYTDGLQWVVVSDTATDPGHVRVLTAA